MDRNAEGGAGRTVIGWDVGGAHLKAARVTEGRVEAVVQEPCALWQGLGELDAAFANVTARIGTAAANPVTMTGELVDLFTSRREGVEVLATLAGGRLAGCSIYAGAEGWVQPVEAGRHEASVASANWHATAALVALMRPDALILDMGSTTTDVIPVAGGRIVATGRSDAERLACGELVYTGAVRTALMAVARQAPAGGRMQGVMAEYFATMGDVNRLLGRIGADADQHPAADGRGKSIDDSRLRLSRMLGRDLADLDEAGWLAVAHWFAEAQMRDVHDAALMVLSTGLLSAEAPVIGCGVGSLTLAEVARRLDRPFVDLAALIPLADDAPPAMGGWAAACAPAVAMALLHDRRGREM